MRNTTEYVLTSSIEFVTKKLHSFGESHTLIRNFEKGKKSRRNDRLKNGSEDQKPGVEKNYCSRQGLIVRILWTDPKINA